MHPFKAILTLLRKAKQFVLDTIDANSNRASQSNDEQFVQCLTQRLDEELDDEYVAKQLAAFLGGTATRVEPKKREWGP
jgi:hypothetical protein